MIIGIAVAIACLVVLFRRGGVRNVLFVGAAFLFLFGFGPVFSIIFELPYYPGIVVAQVPQAVRGLSMALVALLLADLLRGRKKPDYRPRRAATYPFLPIVQLAYMAYGLAATFYLVLLAPGAGKLAQLTAAGPLHPYYLLAGMLLVCSWFLTVPRTLARQLWYGVLVVYVVYNLVTYERDFFLVLASILVHRLITEPKLVAGISTFKVTVIGLGSAGLATVLFVLRSGSSGVVTADVLNQGSILFIDTVIRDWFPQERPFIYGQSYVGALLSLLPGSAGIVDFEPLPTWFVNQYAPTGQYGYGFSMSAEAYMNFGELGVPAVFFLLGWFHRSMADRAVSSARWCTYSTYGLAIFMYALRGDFNQYLKSMVLGGMLLTLVALRNRPAMPKQTGVSPSESQFAAS